MIKGAVHKALRSWGFDIIRFPPPDLECPPDFLHHEVDIVRKVRPWTLTSAERIYALVQAVRYVCSRPISGDIVECGVWKGGSMAAVAMTLLQLNEHTRDLYLFDTFEGMPEPTSRDVDYMGQAASDVLARDHGFKCTNAPLEQVRTVLYATGYPQERIHFVQGRVEDTIPSSAPDSVALLRLDTDWYGSTKHELVHLFPRLSSAGVILIDDYGHWKGAREACDEYFAKNHIPILLNRIDYTGRIGVKP